MLPSRIFRKRKSALTLIEALIAIAIIAIVAVAGLTNLLGVRGRATFTTAVQQMAATLREAQSRAVSQSGGASWGVHFDNTNPSAPTYALFSGAAYSSSTAAGTYRLPSGVCYASIPQGSSTDVVFNPVSGTLSTSTSAGVTLALNCGGGGTSGAPFSQVATTSAGTYPYFVSVSGNYAYVTNERSKTLSIIDVSNPTAPVRVATATVGTYPNFVSVSGNYAYVTNNGSKNLSVVDISNPRAPTPIATVGLGNSPTSVSVSGNYAYVAGNPNTFSVIDVSNPSAPVQIATTSVGTIGALLSVFVSGHYAYMVINTYPGILAVVDVSNPSAPVQVGSTPTVNGAWAVSVSGNYAYVVSGNNVLSVVDVSNPTAPIQIATTTTGTSIQPSSIFVSGRYAYVAGEAPFTYNGPAVIDVSNPRAPTPVATTTGEYSGPVSISVSGNYAYTANYFVNTLSVFNIQRFSGGSASSTDASATITVSPQGAVSY